MSPELLAQVRHLLRPLSNRTANMIARSVVQLVNDGKMLQLVQLGVLAGETVEGAGPGAEHFQPYGFSSVPLAEAEGIVIFPNGDRGHPLLIAVADRRYRPTGGQPGEVTVYNNTGAKITITKDGDIIMHAAPGRTIQCDDGSGVVQPLVRKSDFDGHTHLPGTFAAPSGGGPVTGVSGGAAAAAGTSVLQGK